MSPRVGLDAVYKTENILSLHGIGPRFLGRPVCGR
jgi:hypothetical protein